MSNPYDFSSDYAIWKDYAVRIHSRNFKKKDAYTSLQSVVERIGHQTIASARSDRIRVLEIGVGGGEHLEFERQNGFQGYTAVDIDPDFLALVKSHYPEVETVLVRGSELPFPDGHFTTVVSASTLEHIATLEESLKEINRVLTPNGDFLVLVPRNGGWLIELFKCLVTYPSLRLKGIRKPSLIWHYENINTFKRIRALLTKHFRIKREAPVPFAWLPHGMSPLHFFHCVKSS